MRTVTNIRFGLIGFGAWGQYHADALHRSHAVELAAIATPSRESQASAAAAYPHAVVFGDYREMLAKGDIDAVSIVVPNALHEEVACDSLDAGLHVLLEKPMSLTASSCQRISDRAESAGRILNVAHQLRVSAQWSGLKALIDGGKLGQPQAVNFALWRRPFRSGADGWRYDAKAVGSWMLEELVHYVDLIDWYMEGSGNPTQVSAVANGRNPDTGLWHNVSLRLHWRDGAFAVLSQTLAGFEHHQVMDVACSRGSARTTWSAPMDRASEAEATLRYIGQLSGNERFDVGDPTNVPLGSEVGEVSDLATFVDQVATSIGSGTACVSGRTAQRAVIICEAAVNSIKEGEPVGLSELNTSR